MSTVVDPYQEWLAIPPGEQPANHYRLLGVPLFTDDPYVIAYAAHQRFADIRSKQSAEHALLSQRMFDEIVAAEACLLNPATKSAYDAKLRIQFPAVLQRSQAYVPLYLPLGKQRRQTMPPLPPMAPPVQAATRQSKRRTNWNYVDKRRGAPWKVAIGLAGLLVVVAIGLLVGHNLLPPGIQTISHQYLPPVLLAAIFALLSLYVGLLFPAGRRWIARRGRWGAALAGQAEYDAVETVARNGHDAATFRQLIRETPVAFAILAAVLIFVFVEFLALVGARDSARPSTGLTSAVTEASSSESPASINRERQETSSGQATNEAHRNATLATSFQYNNKADSATPYLAVSHLAESLESSITEGGSRSSEDSTSPVSAQEKPLAESSESPVTEVHAQSSDDQPLPANGDEVAKTLQAARKQHEDVVNRAKASLDRAIDEIIEESAAGANLDHVTTLQAEKRAFNSNGSLPAYNLLREAVDAYKSSCMSSYAELIATFEKAVLAYTESREFEKAGAVRSEAFRLIHEAKKLDPEFRSDPKARSTALKEAMNELLMTRTWRDSAGRKVKAKFVRIRKNGRVLLLSSNRVLSVLFNRFSQSDQELLRRGVEHKGKRGILPPASSLVVSSKQRMWTDQEGRKIEGRFARVSSDDDLIAHIEIVPDEDKSGFLHVIQVPYKNLSSMDQQYIRATLSPEDAGRFLPAEVATPVEDAAQVLSKKDSERAEDVLSEKPDAAEETLLEPEDLNDDPPRVAMSVKAERYGQDNADHSRKYNARRRLRSEGEQKTHAVGSRLAEQRTAIGWDTYWMAYIAMVTFLIFVTVLVCRGFIR